jgi:hypothetical protein
LRDLGHAPVFGARGLEMYPPDVPSDDNTHGASGAIAR